MEEVRENDYYSAFVKNVGVTIYSAWKTYVGATIYSACEKRAGMHVPLFFMLA
jgi:hypothetical protein